MTNINAFWKGELIDFIAEVKENDTALDADSVIIHFKLPTEEEFSYPMTRTALGTYKYTLDTTQSLIGLHFFRILATGNIQAANVGHFAVSQYL
jgi:hypothetical protein